MTVAARRPEADTERLPRRGEVRIRTVPARRIIEVRGEGRPATPAFEAAVGALYGVAYGVHFALKRRGIEARVGALEGLWTFDREPWRWTLLIELPPGATDDDVAAAVEAARAKRPSPALDALRAVWFQEGEVVEALHVGPYATEPETIAGMAAATEAAGREAVGPHHEIYLGDPRRAAPERLRTVLRQPIGPRQRSRRR